MTDTEIPAAAAVPATKPLWKRVIEFPLVAMVLAALSLMLCVGLPSFLIGKSSVATLPETTKLVLAGIIAPLLAIAAVKLLVARLGEEPRDDLPFNRSVGDLWRGTLVAFVLMSLIVGVTVLLGGYRIEGAGGATSWAFLLFVAGTQAAVLEEILMRGILFRFLEEFGGSWFALALSSAVFGFGHALNPNASTLSSVAIAMEAGILLGGAYMLTRNLWLAIGLHFGWNVTQGLIWDVAVSGNPVDGLVEAYPQGSALISGGAFGLEASMVAMILATATGVVLVMMAVRRGHVVRPWWVRRRLATPLPAAS